MAEVELTTDTLVIHAQVRDRILTFRSRLEIPLTYVVGAEADPEIARAWWGGFESSGLQVPEVGTVSSLYKDGGRVFWNVHHPEKNVVIQLRDEKYTQLVIEVKEPAAMVATIQKAIGKRQ
jgi:hypothetical protein